MTGFMLTIAVVSSWVGTFSLFRLRTPLSWLHALSFIAVLPGACLVLAGFADEGVTTRTLKILALWLFLILSGAATSHAITHALAERDGPDA
jgi:multisubunit Na+/H+ antiporter MnhG subunit